MTLSTNDYVRVSAGLGSLRRGRVVGLLKGDRVEVELDVGRTVKVHVDKVEVLERKAPSLSLVRPPTYSAKLASVTPEREVVRSSTYLGWIRRLPCAWCRKPAPSEASHHPEAGHGSVAMKASDLDVLPLCSACHREWHQRTALGSMTSEDTKAWCQVQIKRAVQRYLAEGRML